MEQFLCVSKFFTLLKNKAIWGIFFVEGVELCVLREKVAQNARKWVKTAFLGLLSSDESVQSRSVCRTEKRVFFIVFVGIPDIFIIFAPKIKLQRYGTERRYRKNREQNYRHSR